MSSQHHLGKRHQTCVSKRIYIVAKKNMGLIGLLFQKGYLFLRCMYILKTSKLLTEEWREKKKKRRIILNQFLSQPPQSEHSFSTVWSEMFLFWCRPVVSITLGVHAFSSVSLKCHILFLKTHYIFFFVSFHHTLCFPFSTPVTSGDIWVLCFAVSHVFLLHSSFHEHIGQFVLGKASQAGTEHWFLLASQ